MDIYFNQNDGCDEINDNTNLILLYFGDRTPNKIVVLATLPSSNGWKDINTN